MVSDHEKEFSGSIGKYPSSNVGDSDNDLSGQVYLEGAHTFTMTCSDKFSRGGKELENEMSSLKRFKEFGSVSKVSSDRNYQRIGGQSRSVMSPIEVIYCFLSHDDCTSCLHAQNHLLWRS